MTPIPSNNRAQTIREAFYHLRKSLDAVEQLLCMESEAGKASPQAPPPSPVAPPLSPEKFAYTLKEVSKLIGISRSTLYKAIADGRISPVKVGHRTLIRADELRRWIDSWSSSALA